MHYQGDYMTTISEAITTIKKAENDADRIIEEAKQTSFEMKDDAKQKTGKIIQGAKDEANEKAGEIVYSAEDDARKETSQIAIKSDENIKNIKNEATGNIDEAMESIVKNIL